MTVCLKCIQFPKGQVIPGKVGGDVNPPIESHKKQKKAMSRFAKVSIDWKINWL
jgi:hypothetical protein